MARSPLVLTAALLAVLAAALAGCAAEPDPPTFGIPTAAAAQIRITPCPRRVPVPAQATGCPRTPM